MKPKHLKYILPVAVLAGAVQPGVAATAVYDSGGFESPKFTTGNLDGQDNSLWIESGGGNAGTAILENTTAFSGTQAVAVNRTATAPNGGDKRYWPVTPVVTPTAGQNYITVSWDMKVTPTVLGGVSTGPFFGIEAYDPNVNLIAGAGVDATTGEILFTDPAFGGGFNNTTTDATIKPGSWNHFMLAMNFTTDVASIYLNGALMQTVNGFDSTGVTKFSDADLSAVATNVEPVAQTGTAFFDNYVVSNTNSVPEPASFVAAGACGLLRRRRRGRR